MERSVEDRQTMMPRPTPQQRDNLQRMKLEQKVFDLNGATMAFRNIMQDVTKKVDVNLANQKVGTIFENKVTRELYLVMFKREFYHQFSKHFPQVPDLGFGMICNTNLVRYAASEEMTLVAVMPKGIAYKCNGKEAWEYYEKWKTDVPHIEGEMGTPARIWPRLF
jgi:hypothetical protein